jgi:hypothetical protein
MVEHALLLVPRTFRLRLWPDVTIKLRVTLAARAGRARIVGILLDKCGGAVGAAHPGHVWLSEEARGELVVAGFAVSDRPAGRRWRMVLVFIVLVVLWGGRW